MPRAAGGRPRDPWLLCWPPPVVSIQRFVGYKRDHILSLLQTCGRLRVSEQERRSTR